MMSQYKDDFEKFMERVFDNSLAPTKAEGMVEIAAHNY